MWKKEGSFADKVIKAVKSTSGEKITLEDISNIKDFLYSTHAIDQYIDDVRGDEKLARINRILGILDGVNDSTIIPVDVADSLMRVDSIISNIAERSRSSFIEATEKVLSTSEQMNQASTPEDVIEARRIEAKGLTEMIMSIISSKIQKAIWENNGKAELGNFIFNSLIENSYDDAENDYQSGQIIVESEQLRQAIQEAYLLKRKKKH